MRRDAGWTAVSNDEREAAEQRIMEHWERPYHRGRLQRATHVHREDHPVCGDHVTIQLVVTPAGVIAEAWFEGTGCCISQAAASMLMEQIEGWSVEQVERFTATDMLRFFGVRLTAGRQHCCLLPWKALRQAIYSPCRYEQ